MLTIPVPARSTAAEYLDSPHQHASELPGNLQDIRRLNAWFGGTRLAVNALARVLSGKRQARILDVATGSADIPHAMASWAASRGLDLHIVAGDISPEVLVEARRHLGSGTIRLAPADARALPWTDGAFDVACCCLALHHFSAADAVQVLKEMWRVSSHAVVVTDLTRSYAAYVGTWLATHTVATNALTRHDGPLSVLRAFTPRELVDLAAAAGIAPVSVEAVPMFRQVLIGRKEPLSGHE